MTPEAQTDTTTSVETPPVTVTTTPPPASPPATISAPGYRQEEVFADDGKRWRDKFVGLDGALKQVRAQLESKINDLNAQVEQRNALIDDLNAQLADASTTLQQMPVLQTQIDELTQQAALANKLRLVANYPDLLRLQVEQEVPGPDGGDPVKTTVNPLLALIESSTLEGAELEAQIAHLATLYKTPAAPQAVQPVAPTPATPADQQNSIEYWRKVADEAREAMNGGDMSMETRLKSQEAWQKIRELQIAAA